MNSKERVKCAFAHRQPDRVPVSELYINSPVASEIIGRTAFTGWSGHIRCGVMNNMLIQGRAEEFYHREAEDLVDVYRALELDTILIERPPLAVPQIPVAIDDTTWKFEDRETGLWNVVHYDPKTDLFHTADSNFHHGGLDEFARYVELLERDEVNLDNWSFKQAEYIMDKCGKDKFVMAVVEIDFPPMSMGAIGGLFLEAMAFEPELCHRYLDYRLRKGIKFVEKYASMGVDCIFDGEDLAGNNGPLFSPAMYMDMYAPRFKALSDVIHAHNMLYLRHTDGNIMRFADEFLLHSGFDGYQSVDPSAGMDIAEIKAKYGDKITIMGNVDCGRVLHLGTKEDVIEETKKVISIASPGGGHILSSSNTIHSSVPTANFMQMLETARKYGSYPISID
jgi:uroporphyrinogen decarboxylase